MIKEVIRNYKEFYFGDNPTDKFGLLLAYASNIGITLSMIWGVKMGWQFA